MKARWITFLPQIEQIMEKCEVCNLAMVDSENMPYVVPMNFGYKDGVVYFHGDQHGRKMDILRANPNVAISFSTDHELAVQNEDVACSYSMKYRSVFAKGQVFFIEDYDAKIEALNIIMANYSDRTFGYNSPAVKNVCVFAVKADKFEGKEFGRFV